MRIRFLQTVPSMVEGFPFMAGQVITVSRPAPEILAYLDGKRAEAVRQGEPEYAVTLAPVPVRQRRRPRLRGTR